MSATLLLGACDLLWNPFQQENPDFCDPSLASCARAHGDGGADAAVADATFADVDAAGSTDDLGGAGDAAVGDAAPSPDLLCSPSSAYPWVADPTPPGAGLVTLTGVTGSGTGDVWTVGNPAYAAHRRAAWTAVSVSLVSTFGRAAYGPKQRQALALGSDSIGDSVVVHLTTTDTSSTDIADVLAGLPGGIWVSGGAENTPYFVAPDNSFLYYTSGVWFNVDLINGPTPVPLSDLSGSGSGSTTALWGVSATTNKLAAYTSSSGKWQSLTTGANSLSAVWVSPNNGVVMAGKGGTIVRTAATLPLQGPVSMNSPVTADLTDIAGTADGKHLWAVGAGGTIVHFDAACGMWVQETSPTAKNLSALWVSDGEKTVWAVGASGTVLHRTIP